MSSKITGTVWDCDLNPAQQLVLLSLADHADHDGNNVFPTLDLTAWKTGYSRRQVMRIQKELIAAQILIEQGRHGRSVVYRIDLSNVPRKKPFEKKAKGDKMSPQMCHSYVTSDVTRPYVKTTPNHQEPSTNLNTVASTPLPTESKNHKTPPKTKVPAQPRKESPESVLFRAVDHHFFNDAGYRNLIVWGILNGRPKQGIDGIIKAECERQHKTKEQLDFVALAAMVSQFKDSLPTDERTGAKIELRDPIKYCIRWEGWRNTTILHDCPTTADHDPNCPFKLETDPAKKCVEGFINEPGNPHPCDCRVRLWEEKKARMNAPK